jgi:hypothetical protein
MMKYLFLSPPCGGGYCFENDVHKETSVGDLFAKVVRLIFRPQPFDKNSMPDIRNDNVRCCAATVNDENVETSQYDFSDGSTVQASNGSGRIADDFRKYLHERLASLGATGILLPSSRASQTWCS